MSAGQSAIEHAVTHQAKQAARSIAEEFESDGFWHCRQLNKWLLVVVTLSFGIALGADIIYELMTGRDFPIRLTIVGLLSVSCVILLWICVTYAAVAGVVLLVLALFVDGMAYSVLLALLITGLTSMTSTKRFRRVTLVVMIGWAALMGWGVEDPGIALLSFLGVALLLLCAYGLGGAFRQATNARLQSGRDLEDADERHLESVAAERKTIARDLHDIVAHDITIIAMQSRAAKLKDTDEAYRDAVDVIGSSSRAALNDLRRVLTLLSAEEDAGRDSSATGLDVRSGVDSFAQRLESLGITLETSIFGDIEVLSRSVNAALYRILQECTTNIAKYAGEGAQCWIEITVGEDTVELRVSNTVSSRHRAVSFWSSSGAGLIGVRDRAQAFGGVAKAGYDRQGRWTVSVRGMKKS